MLPELLLCAQSGPSCVRSSTLKRLTRRTRAPTRQPGGSGRSGALSARARLLVASSRIYTPVRT